MSYIEVIDEVKKYQMGDTEIIANDHINFSIEQGEVAVILGPSGAGKSTVLNILGGMDTATSGHVIVDKHIISKYIQYRQKKLCPMPSAVRACHSSTTVSSRHSSSH